MNIMLAVHCKTKEEAENFIGIVWLLFDTIYPDTMREDYKQSTCYNIEHSSSWWSYAHLKRYKNHKYNIIDYKYFIEKLLSFTK